MISSDLNSHWNPASLQGLILNDNDSKRKLCSYKSKIALTLLLCNGFWLEKVSFDFLWVNLAFNLTFILENIYSLKIYPNSQVLVDTHIWWNSPSSGPKTPS